MQLISLITNGLVQIISVLPCQFFLQITNVFDLFSFSALSLLAFEEWAMIFPLMCALDASKTGYFWYGTNINFKEGLKIF